MVKHSSEKSSAREARPRLSSAGIRTWRLLLVLVVAFLCYVGTAGYQFVWDDNDQIVGNSRIRSFAHMGDAFQENFWAFYGHDVRGHYYRPLQTASYMLGYAIGGVTPPSYHWLNIILHLLASLAVVWLGWEMFRSDKIAFWGGLLFAAHPMHTESVAWSAGITDLGCGLFYFVSLAAYLRADRGGRRWSWLSGLAFLAALLYKEMALTLPALALGLDWVRARNAGRDSWSGRFTRWLPLFLALAVYLTLRIHALSSLAPKANDLSLRLWDRILTIAYLAGLYLVKLVLPFGHNAYRVFEPFSRLSPAEWGPPLILLSAFIGLLWQLRAIPGLLFAACWVLISLAPVLSLESVGQNVFAERYLYIPSAGFCLLLPALAESFNHALSMRKVQILALGIVAALAVLTVRRNPIWQDDRTFYTATLSVSPDAAMMHQNLGVTYYREGDRAAALREFEAARAGGVRAFIPSARDAYNALIGIGTVYADSGRLEEAWQVAGEANRLDPGRGEAYFVLGTILSRQEKDAEAEPLLGRAVALKPNDVAARINLGSVLLFRRKAAEAELHFRAALDLDPQSIQARLGLAMCHQQAGRSPEAVRLVREVLARDPRNPDALRLLNRLEPKAETGR